MDKHFDALNSQRGYVSGETLRETVGSVLDQLGKDWDDVRGMALCLHEGYYEGDILQYLDDDTGIFGTGMVKPSKIAEILDVPASKLTKRQNWGVNPAGDDGAFFSSTVWLDDAIILFSQRYDAGEYVACEVFPTAPSPTYAFEAPSSSPSP